MSQMFNLSVWDNENPTTSPFQIKPKVKVDNKRTKKELQLHIDCPRRHIKFVQRSKNELTQSEGDVTFVDPI